MPATKFEKGKVKEKIDPKVLSALSNAFGYKVDDVDDLDYEEYHNELREAIQIGKESLSSAEMGLLVMERKRIRSEKSVYKEDFKEKKTTMTAADIKKGSAMQLAENSALSLYKGGVGQSSEETDENLVDIEDKLDDILESLKEEGKLGKDQAAAAKKKAEQEKRAKKEKNLERWTALKKTTSKVLKPFRSIWDKIFGFLKTILLGSALFNIIKWMGDPKNQDKLNNIFRFFKDWWPTLLAAYLLFGNSFGRMAVKLGVMVGKFAIRLASKLIPKLLAGLAKIKAGSLLKGGLVTGAVVGTTYLMGKMIGKDKEGENLAEAQNQSREAIVDEGNMDEGEAGVLSQSVVSSDIGRMTQGDTNIRSDTNMLQTGMNDPLRGGLGGDRLGLNEGGEVPGQGDTDTVPAMLTPGEFVMSKGAVEKYGADTMAGLNAAAGGTNKPTIASNTSGITGGLGGSGGGTDNAINDAFSDYLSGKGQSISPTTSLVPAGSSGIVPTGGDPEKTSKPSIQGLRGGGLVPIQGLNSGGLVQGFQGGGQVRKMEMAPSTVKVPKINPPVKKSPVVLTQKIQNISKKNQALSNTGTKIPEFDAEKYISVQKIKTLGITV